MEKQQALVYSPFKKEFEKVDVIAFFDFEGYSFHIRKGREFIDDEKDWYIISEVSSTAIFAKGMKKKEAMLQLEITMQGLTKRYINNRISITKCKCFDGLKTKASLDKS